MDFREIDRIRSQFDGGQWQKFLESVSIDGLRGWEDQVINFRFPVVAIVGENGSGKSTVLKTAACIYANSEQLSKNFFPAKFFIDTHWDKIENVTLRFRVRQGNKTEEYTIRKPSKRWSIPEDRPKRPVYIFEISRTLPLDATAGYAKIAREAAEEIATSDIDKEYTAHLSYTLGKRYSKARFVTSDVNAKEIGLLESEIGEISQFHQGAGEDTTLDLFRSLQSIPKDALVIIDEVEASLHPKAQRRLVRVLLQLSREKRCQFILSTHSPYVIQELPSEARVLLLRGSSRIQVINGITPEFAMSRLDDENVPELNLFTEDKVAATLLREIIASHASGSDILQRVSITDVGPAHVVKTLGSLAAQNKLPYKGLGVLDGDQDATSGCIKLPGDKSPERVVFDDLESAHWPELPARFGIGAGELLSHLEDAILNPKSHEWTRIIGDRITMSSTRVWDILASQWCKTCLSEEDRNAIISDIEDRLSLIATYPKQS